MGNNTTESALHLGWRLAVAIMLGLTLLFGGAIGVGLGIRYGAVAPADLEAHMNGLHIVAFSSYLPKCPPYPPCPSADRSYYEIWSIYEPTTGQLYGRAARRLLLVPLKR